MIAALVLFATWVLLGIPAALVAIPWTLMSRDIRLLYRWGIGVVRAGLWIAGIRVRVEGRERLEVRQPYLFFANHLSNLDPPILIPVLPHRVSVFLKRSLMKIPILGYGMRLANFIPVDRDGRVESAKESADTAARVLASGISVLSFVEGTRSRDGRLQVFKKGPFYLAMETGAPVVPVSIHGTESMMKKGSFRIFPGTAHVTFHAPILPRDFTSREELMEAVRAAIASGLPEWMRS
jgi:1-acyl-sn-glycerol-3-phosphate acyltransferase